MIRSEVKVFDRFPAMSAEIRRRSQRAVVAAAEAGAAVARTRAGSGRLQEFKVHGPVGTEAGFVAGIKGNPLVRIFDHGSLGRHKGELKRSRKESWKVTRRGSEYEAHRRDVSGKGVEARNILSPARTAGRKALIETLLRG